MRPVVDCLSRRRGAAYPIAFGTVLGVGLLLRSVPVLTSDFPLNDGGLFLVVVEDLRRGHYALPWFTSYNGATIPFVYPPLAFYAAALLVDVAHVDPLDVFRFLPLVVNILTVAAFAALARAAIPSAAAVAATAIFAILPGSFVWFIMGGGITRSLGFLFVLLGLHQAYRLYTRGGARPAVLLALFAGLTLWTHLALSLFLALSVVLLLLYHGRHRQTFLSTVGAGTAAVALAAPWWGTVLSRHGVAPFLAASETGSLLTAAATDPSAKLPAPVLLAFALLALAACVSLTLLRDQRFFLLGWMGTMFILDSRTFAWLMALPLALGDGHLVARGILPILGRLWPGTREEEPQPVHRTDVPGPERLANWIVGGVLVFLTIVLSGLGQGSMVSNLLAPLSSDERTAMHWVAQNTPEASGFLVVTGDVWAWDRSSEWFPVLAHRISVATPQGLEWLPGGEFVRRRASHFELRACTQEDAACLDRWSASNRLQFSHVYVARRFPDDCCAPFRESLRMNSGYLVVYDGPGATIFARR